LKLRPWISLSTGGVGKMSLSSLEKRWGQNPPKKRN
jgi:hypothetical protein